MKVDSITVKQLKDKLENYPDDMKVFAEGACWSLSLSDDFEVRCFGFDSEDSLIINGSEQ